MPVTEYKKAEKEFADRIASWFRRALISIGNFFKYIMVKGKQRFTVMLIPHSEKKIFNFQISFFTLIFVTLTLSIILVGFFILVTHFTYTNEQNVRLTQERDANEKTLTSLKDEIVRLYTGNAFDVVGERRQTNFRLDSNGHWLDESFEIKVRNHKKDPVTVRVVEHLYRWLQWEITANSMENRKTDARTMEFRPVISGGGEAVIRYTVHYTW